MITDLGEIWIVLAVPFVVGCLLGSLLYRQLSFTRLAPIQNAIVVDFAGFFGGAGLFGSRRPKRVTRPVAVAAAGAPPTSARPAPAPAAQTPPPAKPQPVLQPAPAPVQRAAPQGPVLPPAPKQAPPTRAPAAAPKREPPPKEVQEPESFSVRPPTPEETRDGRPPAMLAPRDGKVDDLRRIRGIGESYQARLHALGIFHYEQIAAWSLVEAAWVAMQTGAGDRVVRYDWIGQARAFAGLDGAPPEEE